jgi:O-antigen/teichoic acid export membrane protein
MHTDESVAAWDIAMRRMLRRLLQDEFIFHTGVVVAGMQLANFLNLLYHLVVVRILSYEEYGALNALVVLSLYLGQFAAPFQTALTRFLAIQISSRQIEESRSMIRRATVHIGIISVVVIIAFAAIAGPFARMQRIGDSAEVVMIGFLVAASLMASIPQAFLQGAQLFPSFAAVSASSGLAKFLVGVGLVWLGYGVRGGVWGFIASPIVLIVAGYFLTARYFACCEGGGEERLVPMRPVYKYCIPAGLVLLSFTILTNADVTLVKRFFSPLEAVYYPVAQMVGKIILFLPGAVSIVVFPKAASPHARRSSSSHLLKKGMTITSLLCGAGVLICCIAPASVLGFLAGKTSPESVALVPWFSVAMGVYAIVWVLASYNLSIHNIRFVKYLGACALVQVAAISVYHPSLESVLGILNLCAPLTLIVALVSSRILPAEKFPEER